MKKEIERAKKFASKNRDALAYAGHSIEDFVFTYCETLSRASKNYNPVKGNWDQFCSGVIKNVFKEMTKGNQKLKDCNCHFYSFDDIMASYEAKEEENKPSSATKSAMLDFLQGEATTKLSSQSRVDFDCYLEIAEKVFQCDSLEYKIFVCRFLNNYKVKRTQLAYMFNVSVEAIRWAEDRIAAAADKFDVQRLTESERKRRNHNIKPTHKQK